VTPTEALTQPQANESTSEDVWKSRGVTGEPNTDPEGGEYKTHLVQLWLCEGCLLGIGKECHTGGCALVWHRAPDFPVMPELVKMVGLPPIIEVGKRLRDASGEVWSVVDVQLGTSCLDGDDGTVTIERCFSSGSDRVVMPMNLAETMRGVE
jgi:hypothetical protein